MKLMLATGFAFLLSISIFGQALKKLRSDDITSIQGKYFDVKPCGARSPTPEQDLQRSPNQLTRLDRAKLLASLSRAKNVMTGCDKWWSTLSISLRDGRRIIVDGNGYFCIRTIDPSVFYFYQFEKKDFETRIKIWNDIKALEK